MKRLLCLAALVAGSGCFEFDKRLASCRNDAGTWLCGGDGGATGEDGGGQVLVLPGREGLVCQQGWCWEHPRPAGLDLRAIWGTSRDDFFVGGVDGVLAHWDGTRWTGRAQGRDLTVKALCGHDGDVYAGMGTYGAGSSAERLLRHRAGQWTSIGAGLSHVEDLSCGTRLLVAHWDGLSAGSWPDPQPTVVFQIPGQSEITNSVLETGPNDCLVSSHENGGTVFARLRQCDGGIAFDSPMGEEWRIEALWNDATRGPLAAVSGSAPQVIQRDTGWQSIWTGDMTRVLSTGAPTGAGSIAGGPNGTIVEFTATQVLDSEFKGNGNGYIESVFVTPTGETLAVGEWGCILERTGSGWVRRNDCHIDILDVSFGPRLLALTARFNADGTTPEGGVSQRTSTGWSRLLPLDGSQRALREQQDGGLVFLTDSSVMLGALALQLPANDAQHFELVSDTRAVVVTQSGAIIEVTLSTGEKRIAVQSGAAGQPVVDERGVVWVRGADGSVFVSRPGSEWVTERVTEAGALTDLSVGYGKLWALRDATVYWRSTSTEGWSTVTATRTFTRLAPLSSQAVLLLSDSGDALQLTLQPEAEVDVVGPPAQLGGPISARNGEVWAVGLNGGLLRFKAP